MTHPYENLHKCQPYVTPCNGATIHEGMGRKVPQLKQTEVSLTRALELLTGVKAINTTHLIYRNPLSHFSSLD